MNETPASPPTHARYGVLAFTLVLTAISYLDRVCISMAGPFIQDDLHLTDRQLGIVFGAFTFAYAALEMPAGWLADRFGPRLMLARVVIWWSLMTAATGCVGGFASLLIVRFLFGMGEAGTFPGISRAYVRWLPDRAHGNAFGLAIMTALVGGALTQKLTAFLLAPGRLSWRWVFPLYALAGVAWAVAWYWWFRDDPHNHRSVNEAELRVIGCHPPAPHPPVPWRAMIRNRSMLAICGMYFGVIYGWYFFISWFPKYLMKARGFDLKATGSLAMWPLLCMGAGVAFGGWLSDVLTRRWGSRAGRRTPGLIGLPLASVIFLAGTLTNDPKHAAIWMGLAAGFASMGVAPGWAVCLEIGGKHAGVVAGAMNTFGNLGGTLMPLVMGWCLDLWGSWNISLLTVAFFYLFAAVCWLWIDPKRPLPAT